MTQTRLGWAIRVRPGTLVGGKKSAAQQQGGCGTTDTDFSGLPQCCFTPPLSWCLIRVVLGNECRIHRALTSSSRRQRLGCSQVFKQTNNAATSTSVPASMPSQGSHEKEGSVSLRYKNAACFKQAHYKEIYAN